MFMLNNEVWIMETKFQRAGIGYPRRGDLIRSDSTPDYINLVTEVSEEQTVPERDNTYRATGRKYVNVKSVRAYHRVSGKTRKIEGRRARSFRWYKSYSRWDIVALYDLVRVDNQCELEEHLKCLSQDVVS
jgi:hypothetical protein